MTVLKPVNYIDSRYLVEEEIGKGGMGTVFKVLDIEQEREYALKICNEHQDNEIYRRFRREIRLMNGIKHANVMDIENFNETSTPPYFVMPLALHNLREEMSKLLTMMDKLSVFEEMCKCVQAIHISGVTHRDLKPDNFLRMPDKRMVVTDLGLARPHIRDTTILTQTNVALGTEVYFAPEQYGGSRDATIQTDIYQLGKILYELVTGDLPVHIDINKLDPNIGHIVTKATAFQPELRYQTVGGLIDAVNRYVRTIDNNFINQDSFEVCLKAAIRNPSDSQNIENILFILLQGNIEGEEFNSKFERIQVGVLQQMSLVFPERLKLVLEKYCRFIEDHISGYGFSYAERVANTMKPCFDSASNMQVKVYSLKATLLASVMLNRFAAMEVFDQMLVSIRDEQTAFVVAEMLREEMDYYQHLKDRIPLSSLHPLIQEVANS